MTSARDLVQRAKRLLTPSEPATNRARNMDYPQAAPASQVAAVLREILPDKFRWQRVRYTTPPAIEAYGELEDGYPLETTPLDAYRSFVYSATTLSANFFPLLASKRNGAWVLVPAKKLQASVLPAGQMPDRYPATVDLCPRVDFVPWPVKHGDVTYLGLVSRKQTQIRNADAAAPLCDPRPLGFADWVFANWALNLVTGALQVTVKSGESRCVGGFCVVKATNKHAGLGAALRGVLRGWIIILSSGTEAPPTLIAAGQPVCGPYGPASTDPACTQITVTDPCPYCHPTPTGVDCTIEREGCSVTTPDDECVCDPGVGSQGITERKPDGLMPGARFTSNVLEGGANRGLPDIYGHRGEYLAQTEDGVGLVVYTLNPSYPILVDPLWPDPRTVQNGLYCAWLCRATIHNESSAWRVWCNEVIQSPDGSADQNVPKLIEFNFAGDQHICNVHFQFGATLEPGGRPCFQLNDQNCFTAHPDHDTWGHVIEGDTVPTNQLIALDSLGVYLADMSIAPSGDYPHRHPSVLRFMNDVLRTAAKNAGINPQTRIINVDHATRYARYNEPSINSWTASRAWGCPAVVGDDDFRRFVIRTDPDRGIETTPWIVRVRMANTTCQWVAFVMLSGVEATLRLSSERNHYLDKQLPSNQRRHAVYFAQFRLVATVQLYFQTGPQLCEGIRRAADATPCEARFTQGSQNTPVDRPLVYTLDEGGDYAPLTVEWRGMLGPLPWAKRFEQRAVGSCIGWDQLLNEGLDIPGEVNDTALNGAAPQRFGGRVLVTT